jgi:hypothetical protein
MSAYRRVWSAITRSIRSDDATWLEAAEVDRGLAVQSPAGCPGAHCSTFALWRNPCLAPKDRMSLSVL